MTGPPDLEPRPPWRAVSPVPEDSNLQGVSGSAEDDYFLITSGAIVHRVQEQSVTEWRPPPSTPPCLRGVLVVGAEVFVSGGCRGMGLLLRRGPSGAWTAQELPNLELAGLWARSPDEVFVASPSAGVVRVLGGEAHLERTVAQGELGNGPVTLWGTGAGEVFAAGNGRILRRRAGGQWDVERSVSGEVQFAIWGSGPDDIYVAGATEGGGAIWHRVGAGTPFRLERLETGGAGPRAVLALWGDGAGEVFAASEGGLVLRRNALSGAWVVERPAAEQQPTLRALWGARPGHLLLAGPGGLLRRSAGRFEPVLGQALTGVTLRAVALGPDGDGLAVGDAGVVLGRRGGAWQREAPGLPGVGLQGVATLPDGTAYIVGQGGVVLRRDRDGAFSVERPPGAPGTEDDLHAVAVTIEGEAIAVGAAGRILRRRGGAWQAEPPMLDGGAPLRVALRAVAVLPDGAVVAVGDEGTAISRPPGAARFSLLVREPSAGISYTGLVPLGDASAPGFLACASGGAVLLRLSDGQLRQEPSPTAQARALWAAGASDVYLAGADGVWHFGGRRWAREPAPPGEALLGVGGSGGTVVAAGEHGYLIERP